MQASVALTTGWAEGLLKTGKIAATAALPSGPITLELDTETGSWSPNKERMRFNTVHDSHIHVGLQN